MRYPVRLLGMEGRVEVATSSLTGRAQLLVDGRPAQKGQGKGEYVVPRSDGRQSLIQLTGQRLDLIPKVSVDGVPLVLAPPLSPTEWIVAVAPIALMFVGGGIGGVCAAFGVITNLTLFRSNIPTWVKYVCACGVTLIALALYVVLALIVRHYWIPSTPANISPGGTPPGLAPSVPGPPSMPAPPPMPGFPGAPGHP